jgi:SAM-dependent methyltransferase
MPTAYDAGRTYSPKVLTFWLDVVSQSVPNDGVSEILDIGCGTGRYSAALADHFDAHVVAIDPSEKMLSEARKKMSEGIRYERASAESLPLPDGSVDMVFMSMVFHHLITPAKPSGNVVAYYAGGAPFVCVQLPGIGSEHIHTSRFSHGAVLFSTMFCNLKQLLKTLS